MFRIIAISIVAAALAVTLSDGQSASETIPVCNSSRIGLTYPMDTPLSYYTCKDANTPLVFVCPDGTGYINNGTLTGCVPWVLWSCTSKESVPACTQEQQLTKFPNVQPNLFWVCQGISLPVAFACPDGSAFIPDGDNSGCKVWSVWSESCPY